ADDADRVHLRLAAGQRAHRAGHRRGAAHVALHVPHSVGGLDRDAAGVEADALADEADRLFALRAAVPAHDRELRLAAAALAHAEKRGHAELLHLLLTQHLDLEAVLLQRLHALREAFRIDDVRRLVDEIPRQ